MEHFGDVSQIKGNEVPAVDVFIGGSPCQDLSIAGQRKGIQHSDLGNQDKTRSGLLLEEIRIIREMRKKDETLGRTGKHVRPRFCVWENVPGAFSSNGGGDFRLVLESFCKIAREDVFVPLPDDGRWENAGCVVGEGFSVAWRVMDARYWGVPQRRRRIALVADFGGKSAPEILFNEKGMRWDSEKSRETWERIAGRFAGCASEKDSGEKERYVACVHCTQDPICNETYSPALGATSRIGVVFPEVTRALLARADSSPCVDRGQPFVAYSVEENIRCETRISEEVSSTLSSGGGKPGQGYSCVLCRNRKPEASEADGMQCYGFIGGGSAKARSIGYKSEESPTG